MHTGFAAETRQLLHAAALTFRDCALEDGHVMDMIQSLPCGVPPYDPYNPLSVSGYSAWLDIERVDAWVDKRQREADERGMRERFGLGDRRLDGSVCSYWLQSAAAVAARAQAGLATPPDCPTMDDVAGQSVRVLERAREEAWHTRCRRRQEAAVQARSAWLARGLRRLGLFFSRADSFEDCIKAFAPMQGKVAKTLHSAVWTHWLRNHTQGRYELAVRQAADAERDSHYDAHPYRYYSEEDEYRGRVEAECDVQAKPEFQMPSAIPPWLPPPRDQTDAAVAEATRAVHACMRWWRAFLRVRAVAALGRQQ